MEGEIDIFKAVRTVRQNRPQLVENIVSLKKIKYCVLSNTPTWNFFDITGI
jgi:hypothetical protein